MSDTNKIKLRDRAKGIRDQTEDGGNTAEIVGQLFVDIAENYVHTDSASDHQHTEHISQVARNKEGSFTEAEGDINAFRVSYTYPINTLRDGMELSFRANNTISGPCTLEVNPSLGAIPVKSILDDGNTRDLEAGEIKKNQIKNFSLY